VNNQHSVIQSVLVESREDFVGLWIVVRRMREEFAHRSDIRELVLNTLKVLISEYGLVIGDFKYEEFVPWGCTHGQAIERVDAEWQTLGRDPDIGEVAWLVSPGRSGALGKSDADQPDQ
jgi:hypothetical protein